MKCASRVRRNDFALSVLHLKRRYLFKSQKYVFEEFKDNEFTDECLRNVICSVTRLGDFSPTDRPLNISCDPLFGQIDFFRIIRT